MSLINWNIRNRDVAAADCKGIDPYEPVTGEDEGVGWGGALIVILTGLTALAHILYRGKE